ncbi:hypothetical protein [Kineococcus sp. SYSU DK006]|uniref:hypothetical protein n=1 Tax=Kineococcus sp. SYSU DK006 TaxID=3383127 RepID=UPI003D7DEB04
MTREEMADAIAADPRLVPLLQRLLFAAGMNGYDPPLAAMGEALGRALDDDGALDESTLLIQVLDGITPVHVQALELLESPAPGRTAENHVVWTNGNLLRKSVSPHLMEMALAGLVARGLVITPNIVGDADNTVGYDLTELGRAVLEVVRRHLDQRNT